MKRADSFLHEAAFGFVVALIAAAVAATLGFTLPGPIVARLVVAGIGLALVLRAISRSDEKTGRLVTLTVWLAVSLGLAWLDIGLAGYVAIHVLLAWLVRSLYCPARLTEALLDLGLTAVAVSFAVLAAVRTDSVFLAVWCLLLVQGMHTAIPSLTSALSSTRRTRGEAASSTGSPADDPNLAFADALKAADEALQRLATRS